MSDEETTPKAPETTTETTEETTAPAEVKTEEVK